MKEAEIPVEDRLDHFLPQVEVVAECTPKCMDATNPEPYREASVRATYQDDEKHNPTGYSFVARANDETALGRAYPHPGWNGKGQP